MKQLIMAIASLNAKIRKVEHQIQADIYGMTIEDLRYAQGRIKGLEEARDLLIEELREAQPDVVRELSQIRAIINKM